MAQSTTSTAGSSHTRLTSPSTQTRTTSFYFKSFRCTTTEGTPLLLHIYCFIKRSLFLYTSSFVCLRYKQKQTKAEMQRKLARDKYEASTALMMLALWYVCCMSFIVSLLFSMCLHVVCRTSTAQKVRCWKERKKERKKERCSLRRPAFSWYRSPFLLFALLPDAPLCRRRMVLMLR